MRMTTRLAVLVASLIAAMSATAEAITWDNRGSTTFTATDTSTGTLSSGGVSLICHQAQMTGTAPNNVVGTTYSVSGTVTMSPCSISGIPTTVTCAYTFTTTSAGPSSFSGSADTLCSVTQFGTETCKIEGSEPVTYDNPHNAPAKWTYPHNTALRATNGGAFGGSHCILGTNSPVTTTAHTRTGTSPNTPTIVRTA
jgi:hypothetical protein